MKNRGLVRYLGTMILLMWWFTREHPDEIWWQHFGVVLMAQVGWMLLVGVLDLIGIFNMARKAKGA